MSAMTLADFSSGYDELIDLYDEIKQRIYIL